MARLVLCAACFASVLYRCDAVQAMSVDLRANVHVQSKDKDDVKAEKDGSIAISMDSDATFTQVPPTFTQVSSSKLEERKPSTIEGSRGQTHTTTCSLLEERAFDYRDNVCGEKHFKVPEMLQAYHNGEEYRSLHGDSSKWWDVLQLPADEQLKFYHQGLVLAKHMMQLLKGEGLLADDWVAGAKALDFGCGLGRMSNALIGLGFPKVVCVDEKPAFLKAARESLARHTGQGVVIPNVAQKVEFVQSAPDLLCVQQPSSVDFVHSILTLEHMKPLLQMAYVEQFCDVLRPGGVGYFQIVTSMPNANKTAHCSLDTEHNGDMIYHTPKTEVERHLTRRGCSVISAAGPARTLGTSMHIIFEKTKPAVV